MVSPNSQHLGDALDLTLPERMEKVPAASLFLIAQSAADASNMVAPMFDNLRTDMQVCLPWYFRPAERRRTNRWPQAIVAMIALLVLAGGLRIGVSLAFLCWWAVATLGLLWALAMDAMQPAMDEKEPAKEAAVMGLVVVQFVSVAAIWFVFSLVRLR